MEYSNPKKLVVLVEHMAHSALLQQSYDLKSCDGQAKINGDI